MVLGGSLFHYIKLQLLFAGLRRDTPFISDWTFYVYQGENNLFGCFAHVSRSLSGELFFVDNFTHCPVRLRPSTADNDIFPGLLLLWTPLWQFMFKRWIGVNYVSDGIFKFGVRCVQYSWNSQAFVILQFWRDEFITLAKWFPVLCLRSRQKPGGWYLLAGLSQIAGIYFLHGGLGKDHYWDGGQQRVFRGE